MKPLTLLLISLAMPAMRQAQGIINTVAGMGPGSNIDNVPATQSALGSMTGKAIVAPGNHIYIADGLNNSVRKVDGTTGIITRIAGTGTNGSYSGDGGPATAAGFGNLYNIALSPDGNLYISDGNYLRIRRVDMQTGIVNTIAGDGTMNASNDSVPALNNPLHVPMGLAFDTSGNLLVAEYIACKIRKIDAVTGLITTISGGNSVPANTGDGGLAKDADLHFPQGLCVDKDNNIYIGFSQSHEVRRIDGATGIITTVAGTGTQGYTGDGGQGTLAQLFEPTDVACNADGELYISDSRNHVVRKIDVNGIISTVAGTGVQGFSGDSGDPLNAEFSLLTSVSVDSCGNLLLTDNQNRRVRKVTYDNCGALAVKEVPIASSLEVYPNPASGLITISSGKNITDLAVFDLTGRILMQQKVNNTSVVLDVTTMAAGIYFLRVDDEIEKFVHE